MDRLSFGANWVPGRNYYFAGLNDQAIAKFDKQRSAPLQAGVIAWSLGLVYVQKKMYKEARLEFERISTTDHNTNPIDYYAIMQSYGYALTGDHGKAKELLDSTLKIKGVWLSPYRVCPGLYSAGDYDKALDQLDKSNEIRDLHMFWIKVDPGFIPIRNKPRFIELMKKKI